MDRLPLVPKNAEDHDILPLITEVFQDIFRVQKYPESLAANYTKYQVDPDFTDVQSTGLTTVKILQGLETRLADITKIEREILTNHALAVIQKHKNLPILEELRLKRQEIFQKLSNYALETYDLIQRKDIYPKPIEQYLDFTYNPTLHTCTQPCPSPKKSEVRVLPRTKHVKVANTINPVTCPFRAEPDKIVFHNYEVDRTFQDKFKLRNVTQTPQYFSYCDFPKNSPFHLKMLTDSNRIAPGMCAEFLVTFRPKVYKNDQESIDFKTMAVGITVPLVSMRDPPRLICYIVDQLMAWFNVKRPSPGNKYFSELRQRALNFTIDCGTCWFGGYSLATVIMKNEGPEGKFFITTENEWLFSQLNESTTRSVEFVQGAFTIFPTFFEIEQNEICQISILFKPDAMGFFNEKLFILCDNNTNQEVELLGDCVLYSNSILTVNMYIMEDNFSYNQRQLHITLPPNQKACFVLSIVNKSPIHLPYFWALKTNVENDDKKKMGSDWIDILHNTKFLCSFSTTDVVVQLMPRTEEEGLYYIFLSWQHRQDAGLFASLRSVLPTIEFSLYLKDIPIVSITDDKFIITHGNDFAFDGECDFLCEHSKRDSKGDLFNSHKLADVHILQMGIFCRVKIPQQEPQPTLESVGTHTGLDVKQSKKNLQLSKKMLICGLIPKGVKTLETVTVKNLTDHDMHWTLKELHYADSNMNILSNTSHISHSHGTLKKKSQQKISYTVEATECLRWVSVLILFACPRCTCQKYTMEDVCMVAYEVNEPKISIKTDNNTSVLCPKDIIYVGIPSRHTIYIHNEGFLIGCFYFLKPMGNDRDKIRLRFLPQSGVIVPGATTPVEVELVASEDGVLEDVHVPCFVGDPDRLISLSILCTIFGINVYFYLPNRDGGFNMVLWPPKSDFPAWDYDSKVGEGCSARDGGECSPASTPVYSVDSLTSLIASDSIAATYPTIKTKVVHVKEATKLTFYFENLTPIGGRYTVNPTNFCPETDCLNHLLVRAKVRTAEFFWEKACLDGCGIAIEPECRSSAMVPYEVVEIHLWIYANTWGKYLEEVIVEINDITPFCFNLVVDVAGLPIEFPFARNTTLSYPTLRFENIAYATKEVTKSFTVTNISAIPVEVAWYTFSTKHAEDNQLNIFLDFDEDSPKLTIPKKFYGHEICVKCININPCYTVLDRQETKTVSVTVYTDAFVPDFSSTHLKYKILGFIKIEACHRFKENYFKRNYGTDVTPAKIEVLATLELPLMQVDLSSDETKIDIFVNDILLTDYKFPEVYLLLRNADMCAITFEIDIDKPFRISGARTIPTSITDQKNLILQRHECLQVIVTCHFTAEELSRYADLIYQRDETKGDITRDFTSLISKNLNVHQKGLSCQMVPFQVRLHFPHIIVKPTFLKFGHCLLYRSKKAMFTIYNMTGSIVKFEIFKTTKLDYFEVHPNHGEIARSTGLNHQFVDVAVYFTPTQCQRYLASLRVLTNLRQYYFDVTLRGNGSNDEKFDVN